MQEEPKPDWQAPRAVSKFLETARGDAPLSIEQIDIMLRLVSAAREEIGAFLVLGGGEGVLAAALLDEFPKARGLVLDASTAAAELTRLRLSKHADRVSCELGDPSEPGWIRRRPSLAPFDTVIAGFATHLLSDGRKRALFQEILPLLQPGGAFLNIDRVASLTRWTESAMDDYLIDAMFGQQLRKSAGATRAEAARDYYARSPKAGACFAPLEVQCDWLRELGYENVDCYFKVFELALFGGQKPVSSP